MYDDNAAEIFSGTKNSYLLARVGFKKTGGTIRREWYRSELNRSTGTPKIHPYVVQKFLEMNHLRMHFRCSRERIESGTRVDPPVLFKPK